MAVEVASLRAVLSLDDKNFEAGLKGAQKNLSDFGKGFATGLGIPLDAFSLGTTAANVLTSAIGNSIAAAKEAAMINRDLEQTLVSTKMAAGLNADELRAMADSLSRVTNFEDDTIASGEAMLLTFTNIKKENFGAAMEGVLDIATKMGTDPTQAAIQYGKALNDPLKGISALQRIGVTFSAQQKEQIKNFMAVNDVASAQKVIMGEIATEFGGQARAAADPVIQLNNAMGNLNEALGTYFLPILNQIVSGVLPGFLDMVKVLGEIMPVWGAAVAAAVGPAFEMMGAAIGDMADALGSLQAGLTEISTALGFGTEKVNLFKVALLPVTIPITILAGILEALSYVVAGVGHAFEAVGYVINQVATALGMTNQAASSASNWAKTMANDWGFLTTAAQTLYQWILNIVQGWRLLIQAMSQPLNTPPVLTPGSPTPMEMGLRGIASAIDTMPSLDVNRMIPVASASSGGGNTYRTTNLNMGGQSFSFKGEDSNEQALVTMLKYVRGKLESGR